MAVCRSILTRITRVLAPLALAALAPAVLAQPLPVERASIASNMSEGNNDSGNAALSPDGRFVGFTSFASNLVPGDTNDLQDVFLHDRETGTTERISIASDGSEADGGSATPGIGGYLVARLGISADGRHVAFASRATNLVAGDSNGLTDVFLRDRQAATTELISVGIGGKPATGFSGIKVAISADGRFVAFDSAASNLVDGDNNFIDVFVRDRQSATTELVSVATGGEQADGIARYPDISADGRFVAFDSGAANLVPGDGNGVFDIFVRDRQAGTTERISFAQGGGDADDHSTVPAISADGRFIAFYSDATNLVAGDTNLSLDVFVHDRQTGLTERVSVGPGGIEGDNASLSSGSGLDISADGRYVVFGSAASNLDPTDTNTTRDVFLHDRDTGETRLVSLAENGTLGDAYSDEPAISDDGRVIAFDSDATTLIMGDTNQARDVFVVERAREPQRFEYSAKIVCGIQKRSEDLPVIPGAYATTVNIHNPEEATVSFFKKLALTIPPGFQKPGEIIPLGEDRLAYDEALATDCADIRKRAFPDGFPDGFIEGYVVIQSPAPLEVDAVYTTGALTKDGGVGTIVSIDVERVPERDRAEGCDLVVEKQAQTLPLNNPDLPQFSFLAVLYTIEVLNDCDREVSEVALSDTVRTSNPGAAAFITLPAPVLVMPQGTLTVGPAQAQGDGTILASVSGQIPALNPGDTGSFQFWVIAVTYDTGAPLPVDLINTATVTSAAFEETLANNEDQTVTPLF